MSRLQQLLAGAAFALSSLAFMGGAQAGTICFAFQDLETEFWVAGHTAVIKALNDAGP
jgi:inositol transport system substrate-binding protein